MKKIIIVLKYIALYYVSYTLIFFSFGKFLNIQFRIKNFVEYTPVNELTKMQLAWSFFGHSYNYNLFLGIIELITSFLLVFKRTRLTGLLLAAGIYTNIVFIDYEFEVNALEHATVEFIIILIWLFPYCKDLKKFLWDMSGTFGNKEINQNKIFRIYLPIGFLILSCVLAPAFTVFKTRPSPKEEIIGAYTILKMAINNKEVELGEGRHTKKPMLFLEFKKDFVLSANDSICTGNYKMENDSIFVSFNNGFGNVKSLKAIILFDENERIIKGLTSNGESFLTIIEKTKQNY